MCTSGYPLSPCLSSSDHCSITALAKAESRWAKSYATVRHGEVGFLGVTSPRLKKNLEPSWRRSVNLDTMLDAIADFPAPGLLLSQRTFGYRYYQATCRSPRIHIVEFRPCNMKHNTLHGVRVSTWRISRGSVMGGPHT